MLRDAVPLWLADLTVTGDHGEGLLEQAKQVMTAETRTCLSLLLFDAEELTCDGRYLVPADRFESRFQNAHLLGCC